MNIAHIESKAVSGDHSGVQSLVRRFAACCLIGVAAMSAAQAGPRDRERDAQAQRDGGRGERMQRQPDERQQRQDDMRAEDQRRNQQIQQEQQNAQNNAEAFRRSGRLTPDERRDLRRQINEAGADIYPNRQRR
jgi:ribulose kinase